MLYSSCLQKAVAKSCRLSNRSWTLLTSLDAQTVALRRSTPSLVEVDQASGALCSMAHFLVR